MKLISPETVEEGATKNYLLRLIKQLTSEFALRPDRNTPSSSVLLASPNGSVYSVEVSDAGVLSAVLKYEAP